MFLTKVADNIKTRILCSVTFSPKKCRLGENMKKKKYGTAGQAADNNTTWRMRFACWMSKATNTHSE